MHNIQKTQYLSFKNIKLNYTLQKEGETSFCHSLEAAIKGAWQTGLPIGSEHFKVNLTARWFSLLRENANIFKKRLTKRFHA